MILGLKRRPSVRAPYPPDYDRWVDDARLFAEAADRADQIGRALRARVAQFYGSTYDRPTPNTLASTRRLARHVLELPIQRPQRRD